VIGLDDDAKARGMTDRKELAEHYHGLQQEAEAIFVGRTTAEWKAALNGAGIPASEVLFPMEMLEDPQVVANGLVFTQEHSTLGPIRLLSSPVTIDKGGFAPAPAVAGFGSETEAILRGLGFDAETVRRIVASGATRTSDA
jgi:crotonobetainyl-CoA:carnitine CoA-transferase CaiB-like acyl-CoA transferase